MVYTHLPVPNNNLPVLNNGENFSKFLENPKISISHRNPLYRATKPIIYIGMVYTHLPVPNNSLPVLNNNFLKMQKSTLKSLKNNGENFQNFLKKRKYSNSMLISHRKVYGKNTWRISTMKNIFSNFLENAKI